MKLKYKLFFSYLVLIIFISIALFLLILQLNGIDHYVRMRIEKDVQEVVDLSHQQEILEKVYASYLLYHMPGQSKEDHQKDLEVATEDYIQNWQQFKQRRNIAPEFNIVVPIGYILYQQMSAVKIDPESEGQNREAIEKICEANWEKAKDHFLISVDDSELSIPEIKEPITQLRENLILLSEVIGQQALKSGVQMHRVAQTLNMVVVLIMIGLVIFSLLIAFFVARLFSRPLEELKAGIEQIAIQNFDVKIEHKSNDELGKLASAYEQMALRLQKNEKFKSEMLGQFTHEMKSPLIAISQAIELLQHTLGANPTVDQKRLLTIIHGNNETLANLITNILHSETYDAETMQLDLKDENITKLMTNTVMKLAPTVKDKEMGVDFNFSSEKITCQIDKDRIEEVFYNLLSNAIKFSPRESNLLVTIFDNDENIEIKLKDTGIGIPQKEIPYIFEKMYRASNSSKISVKGTGLGLYITSQIIKAHGGKIKVLSKENAGTEFMVTLPRAHNTLNTGDA
jgi:signal transduction histidine kinase